MASTAIVALFSIRLFLLTCGHQLRGPPDEGSSVPPVVGAVTNDMQIDSAEAKISALVLRTSQAENTAKAAAAQAATDKLKVEEIYVNTMNVIPELDSIKKNSEYHADQATKASKQSATLAKAIEKATKDIVKKSKLLAVQEVKGMLRHKYKALSGWRHNVLSNPWQKAQDAAAKAAIPYFKTMGQFGATVGAYGLEASNMRSQAAQIAANAKSVAAGAVAKRDAEDSVAAAQDEAMASALATQSKQLNARASTLESQAAEMRGQMPLFSTQAQLAAWTAEYSANPDSVPPPPVDPSFAYDPPTKG